MHKYNHAQPHTIQTYVLLDNPTTTSYNVPRRPSWAVRSIHQDGRFTPTSRERLVDLGVYVTQTMQPIQAPQLQPWQSASQPYASRGGNASRYAYCAAVMRAYTYQTPHGYVGTVGMPDKQKPTNSGNTVFPPLSEHEREYLLRSVIASQALSGVHVSYETASRLLDETL